MGADGLRRYCDSEGDTWRETGPDSGYYYLSKFSGHANESPQGPYDGTHTFEGLDEQYGPLVELETEPTPAEAKGRSLYQHAAAISTAIADAATDGYFVDGDRLYDDVADTFVDIVVPESPKAGGLTP